MKKVISLISSIVICLLFYSCKKDTGGIDKKAFYDCNDSQHLDTVAIAKKLVGTWKMKSFACGECDKPGWHNPDKTIVVSFNSMKEFVVTENSIIVAQGNFGLKIVSSQRWGLNSTSPLNYLDGYIVFCDDEVLFSSMDWDGLDNLFVREK